MMESSTIPTSVTTSHNVDHFKSGMIDFVAGSLGKDLFIPQTI